MMAHIFVIEDNKLNGRLVAKLLTRHSHKVSLSETGEEGLIGIFDSIPDLVLIDLGLPDIDGQTVIALLRDQLTVSIPLIAFTAWPEATAHSMAKAYGCDGVIIKPINTRTFAQQVEAYLTPKPSTVPPDSEENKLVEESK